jgi:hypothetical protein
VKKRGANNMFKKVIETGDVVQDINGSIAVVKSWLHEHVGKHMNWEIVAMEAVEGKDGIKDLPMKITKEGGPLASRRRIRGFEFTAAIAAVNCLLFGKYGEAKGLDKKVEEEKIQVDQIKSYADGITTQSISEPLYQISNDLPDGQVIFVAQGEGSAEKAGSAAGSPNLGFGMVYANAKTSKQFQRALDRYFAALQSANSVVKEAAYDNFVKEITEELGIKMVSMVIDTLENTSRAAVGEKNGPMVVMHLVDGPLIIRKKYEGYALSLTVGNDIAKHITDLSFETPPKEIARAIKKEYPKAELIAYTLGGSKRNKRLFDRWMALEEAGFSIINEGEAEPLFSKEVQAFVSSGSYAPNYMVGYRKLDDGKEDYLINDGYAASAESLQGLTAAAAQDDKFGIVQVIQQKFFLPYYKELAISKLDVNDPEIKAKVKFILEQPVHKTLAELNDDIDSNRWLHFDTYSEFILAGFQKDWYPSYFGAVKQELLKKLPRFKADKIIEELNVIFYESKVVPLKIKERKAALKIIESIVNEPIHENLTGLNKEIQKLKKKNSDYPYNTYLEYVVGELKEIQSVGYPTGQTLKVEDLYYGENKDRTILTIDAMIGTDPYSKISGIKQKDNGNYEVYVRTNMNGRGQMVTRFEMKPLNGQLETSRRRAMSFLTGLMEMLEKGVWQKEKYEYRAGHEARLWKSLTTEYGDYITVGEDAMTIHKRKLAEGNKDLQILTVLKDLKGRSSRFDWLTIDLEG